MELKLLFSFLIFLSFFSRASTGVEEQRKYNVDPSQLTGQKIILTLPFVFHPHSRYITYDIYFDTPKWNIRKSLHSFRLRRVEKIKDKWEYSVQIKSEMIELGQARVELEYKELASQKIGEELLTDLINQFIEDEAARPAISLKFTKWMARKIESSLAPFQKLKDLDIDSTQLRPVVWGHSVRQRYHIYVDKSSTVAKSFFIKHSEKNIFLVPDFFKKQPNLIWLMEASYDRAIFRDALSNQGGEWKIHELEIENKFRPRKLGTALMIELEKKMTTVWNSEPSKQSKYLSSSNHFHKEKD